MPTDVLGNLSGVFSGLLAYAFDTISGSHGLSGWQYLFLFEGLVTVVLGVVVIFLLPDCNSTVEIWLRALVLTIEQSPTQQSFSQSVRRYSSKLACHPTLLALQRRTSTCTRYIPHSKTNVFGCLPSYGRPSQWERQEYGFTSQPS